MEANTEEPTTFSEEEQNENLELWALLEVMYQKYGYDFRNYNYSSIRRQLKRRMETEGIDSISQIQHHVLNNKNLFHKIVTDFYINVTELFRDPAFFNALRNHVIPILKSYPSLKIWHAGCGTGQEVYSMAIMLMEEGLFEKAQIYATDVNMEALKKAQEGIYPVELIKEDSHNYLEAGGLETLTKYCTVNYGNVIMNAELRKHISFFDHNLVTDSSMGEMNLIFCRNVLIYFNNNLKQRAIRVFWESLCHKGFFCAGANERLLGEENQNMFDVYDDKNKIYRKREAA
ncbi:MCP methyltransferase, CheR-type [Nitrospina gracilis 3/211]|uniref:MCP methyltransferase, CheR-type n=1 Tax=Nitrospina gracilis (strain 3/211) TaxID=1266370 RepID=M1YL99_NITG3|nr:MULTISPECIES: protein-glutamate O-methyltransferase CheR [Nitrospina]MCF8724099.1 chemotaxis protein methyltransferase CheR [Nitrospina sp. Nb-3]CCQ91241.1 MCP methyltransferase, CheR-type [Nitrospina gracilis 3/211]